MDHKIYTILKKIIHAHTNIKAPLPSPLTMSLFFRKNFSTDPTRSTIKAVISKWNPKYTIGPYSWFTFRMPLMIPARIEV